MKHIKSYGELNESKTELGAELEKVLSLMNKRSNDFKAVYVHADDFYVDSDSDEKYVSAEYVFTDVDDDDRDTEDVVKVIISMEGPKFVVSIANERFVAGGGDDIDTGIKPQTVATPEEAVETGLRLIKEYKNDAIPEAPF